MIEHDVIVTLTPEDIDLYERARAINLPTIVVSMYGDRIKMLLDEEREACAKLADEYADGPERNYSEIIADAIRARGQA
jgi:hypothetical protein